MAERKQRQYEAMFLFGSGVASDVQHALDLCRNTIERHNGKVIVLKKWDERKLAYELAGQKRGVYVIAYFTAPGDALAHIERDVKLSEEVLRVLITSADHLNTEEMAAVEPQPIVKAEERPSWERSDRYDRGGDRGNRQRRDEESAAPAAPKE